MTYMTRDGKIMSLSLSSGQLSEMPGPPASRADWIAQWSADGRFLYLADVHDVPAKISRREISTGQTSLQREIQPVYSAGVTRIYLVNVAPDGSYAYSYDRIESSDLFVADGLK